MQAATTGRVLMLYFVIRQITAALGLTSLGGHAQMVRPLIAPMAEAAAANRYGELPDAVRQQIRANASAVDNIAVFFGEDIFIAIQSILLIKGFLEQNGMIVEPLHISVWAIPTAVAALLIHVRPPDAARPQSVAPDERWLTGTWTKFAHHDQARDPCTSWPA